MMDNVVPIVKDFIVVRAFAHTVVGQVSVVFESIRVNENMLREVTEHQSSSGNKIRHNIHPESHCRVVLV